MIMWKIKQRWNRHAALPQSNRLLPSLLVGRNVRAMTLVDTSPRPLTIFTHQPKFKKARRSGKSRRRIKVNVCTETTASFKAWSCSMSWSLRSGFSAQPPPRVIAYLPEVVTRQYAGYPELQLSRRSTYALSLDKLWCYITRILLCF